MSGLARAALAKLAHRILKDPTAGNVEDLKKLAAGFLMLVEGKVPK